MRELSRQDLQWCLRRTPTAVLKLLKDQSGRAFVGGGFVRACVANEPVSDIDLFTGSKGEAKIYAAILEAKAGDGGKVFETDNAYTVKGYTVPVQIIHRWTYASPEELMRSFDFTVAMAGFWWGDAEDDYLSMESPSGSTRKPAGWRSVCDNRFYEDLAARRLRYTAPVRHEDVGGAAYCAC
jgi:hypothetical protein